MVECDDHVLSYIRPEMEGDRGQWYRFDERESSCAVSNATAVDSSFGGEAELSYLRDLNKLAYGILLLCIFRRNGSA